MVQSFVHDRLQSPHRDRNIARAFDGTDVQRQRRHPGQSPGFSIPAGRKKSLWMFTVIPSINGLCLMKLPSVLISTCLLLTLGEEPAVSSGQAAALPVLGATLKVKYIQRSLPLGSRTGSQMCVLIPRKELYHKTVV